MARSRRVSVRYDGVYRWFRIRAEPLRDDAGEIVRWYGTSTDIDDRKQAEVALQARERELGLTVNTIPALVWSGRPDGSSDFYNQKFIDYVGVPLGPGHDWNCADSVHPVPWVISERHWCPASL